MKLKITLILLMISSWANSQFLNNFEVEPFYNPLLLNVSNLDKQIITLDEDHADVAFVNRPTNQFGFNINYKFKKGYTVGLGMNWWQRKYDFTLSVREDSEFNYFGRNQERQINIGYQSFNFFVGYNFKLNSRVKLEYSLSNSKGAINNIPEGLNGQYSSSSSGFNYREDEKLSKRFLLNTIGINYSLAIYKNLRFQLGVNFTIKKMSTEIYTAKIEGNSDVNSPKSTFLDLKIGFSSEQFFYTGFTYIIKDKKQ